MIRIPISEIDLVSAVRPKGYKKAVLEAGTVEGNFVCLTPDSYNALREKYQSSGQTITRAFIAYLRWQKAGWPLATNSEFEERNSICSACPMKEETPLGFRCGACGCTGLKLLWSTESCPLKKWNALTNAKGDKI